MANFSEFINNSSSTINAQNSNENKNNEVNKDELEKLIEKYSKYDNNGLMKEFMKLTLEKKRKGELNSKELQSIKQTIAPFLNSEQQSNLDSIINMVDNV